MLLHLDAGDERLPVTGDPVLRDGRPVGRVGTVALHHELGPVALALLKRSVPVDAELVAGLDDRAAPARIDPDSVAARGRDPASRPRRPAAHPPHPLTPPRRNALRSHRAVDAGSQPHFGATVRWRPREGVREGACGAAPRVPHHGRFS